MFVLFLIKDKDSHNTTAPPDGWGENNTFNAKL